MGYGILFFGYFVTFALSLSDIYFFADVIGGLVMMYSFTKLAEYNRYYNNAVFSDAAFVAISLVSGVLMTFGIDTPSGVSVIIEESKLVAAALTHVFILLGMAGISMKAECERQVVRCRRNLVMLMIYFALSGGLTLAESLYSGNESQLLSYLSLTTYVYRIVCIVMMQVLLYRAFALFYEPAKENETAVKKSRFAIINKMEAKMDEFEENRNRYAKESVQMALDEAEKKHAEKAAKSYGTKKKKTKKK